MAKRGGYHLTVQLEADVFSVLAQMASLHGGLAPNELAARYVEQGIEDDDINFGLEPKEVRLFRMGREFARKKRNHITLVTIARALIEHPDEEQFDQFMELCDEFGEDPEDIHKEAKSTASMVMLGIDIGNETNPVNEAISFLTEVLSIRDPDGEPPEVQSNLIKKLAKERGVSENALLKAKDKMGVISVRRPRHWVWMLPFYPDDRGDDILKKKRKKK